MGSRDDHFLDDDRADALMRRVLARVGEPTQAAPPPDLVTSTSRRLPAEPPALAAQMAGRRRVTRLALSAMVVGLVALVALIGLAGTLGGDPRLAMLFGDGQSGLSRALLMLHLAAKPLVRAVSAGGAPLLLAGALALIGGGWLWRRLLLLPAPSYAYAENRQ
jgi:hypothetical protein